MHNKIQLQTYGGTHSDAVEECYHRIGGLDEVDGKPLETQTLQLPGQGHGIGSNTTSLQFLGYTVWAGLGSNHPR